MFHLSESQLENIFINEIIIENIKNVGKKYFTFLSNFF
jgi:hypothetical protein